jgi:hypothetical protein
MARLGYAAVEGANTHFRGTVRLARLASVAEFRQYVDLSKNPNGYCPNHRTGIKLPDDFVVTPLQYVD